MLATYFWIYAKLTAVRIVDDPKLIERLKPLNMRREVGYRFVSYIFFRINLYNVEILKNFIVRANAGVVVLLQC